MAETLAEAVEDLAAAVKRWDMALCGVDGRAAADDVIEASRELLRVSEVLAADGNEVQAMPPYGLFLPTGWLENHVPERLDARTLTRLAQVLPTRLKFATEVRQAALQARGGAAR